jgi:hypothetical protein
MSDTPMITCGKYIFSTNDVREADKWLRCMDLHSKLGCFLEFLNDQAEGSGPTVDGVPLYDTETCVRLRSRFLQIWDQLILSKDPGENN